MTAGTEETQLQDAEHVDAERTTINYSVPAWVEEKRFTWGERITLPEWEEDDETHRQEHGWHGRDLCHDRHAAVRITDYYVVYGNGCEEGLTKGGVGTRLTGIVHFTDRAESHAGLCHGGSMCAVIDDAIGWCAFLVTGMVKPWSGFTVQVNTSLKKPVRVNSTLLVVATIVKMERRKVYVEAELVDPAAGDDNDDDKYECIHAKGDGLTILNRGVLPLGTRETMDSWPSM